MSLLGSLNFLWKFLPWLIVGGIAAALLGYVAIAMRNWKAGLGVAALVAAFFGAQALFSAGWEAYHQAEIKRERDTLQERIGELERLAEADRLRADNDAAVIETLQSQLSTPRNDKPALPREAVKRIQSIRGAK